jgi:hypothetical protein
MGKPFEELSEQGQYEYIRRLQIKIGQIERSIELEYIKHTGVNPDNLEGLEKTKSRLIAELQDRNKKYFSDYGDDIVGNLGGKRQKILPCEPGTKWNEVEITLVSHETVEITTPQAKQKYHFSQLGFQDKRQGDVSTRLWKLLKYFCEFSGRITSETQLAGINDLSKARSDLNKKLQDFFRIKENFCKRYNNKDGWVAKCSFGDKTH